MAVEKMKFITVAGPKDEMNRVVSTYIARTGIHIENALANLNHLSGLLPYTNHGEYKEVYGRFLHLWRASELDNSPDAPFNSDMTMEEVLAFIEGLEDKTKMFQDDIAENERSTAEKEDILMQLEPILSLDLEFEKLFAFEFIRFRFGKMPKESYKKLLTYLDDLPAFFIKGNEDSENVWGVYFVQNKDEDRIDAVFASLYFNRFRISGLVSGTPREAYEKLGAEIDELKQQNKALKDSLKQALLDNKQQLESVNQRILYGIECENIAGNAAHTRDSFYVVGWLPEEKVDTFEGELEDEKEVFYIEEEAHEVVNAKPPTKLKNLKIIKPFEFLVKMYGLPSYKEFDPTLLVAITYTLMFGMMFGDVGQGLLLSIGAFILYKKTKAELAGVVSLVGLSSVLFGFVYGSVFGNEEILRPLWKNPLHGTNEVLLYAVAWGALLISIAIICNIINLGKQKKYYQMILSYNGIVGLLFYWTVLAYAATIVMAGQFTISMGVAVTIIVLALAAIFISEPLIKSLEKKKVSLPKAKGMFILETFFEMFEIVLSFITNTLSFIRVGAFALSHGGMMMVVFLLADMAGSGGSIAVMILGNLLVIGLEGLIVGIQVLRLEFYEMFSRFFNGDGRPFKPVRDQK